MSYYYIERYSGDIIDIDGPLAANLELICVARKWF